MFSFVILWGWRYDRPLIPLFFVKFVKWDVFLLWRWSQYSCAFWLLLPVILRRVEAHARRSHAKTHATGNPRARAVVHLLSISLGVAIPAPITAVNARLLEGRRQWCTHAGCRCHWYTIAVWCHRWNFRKWRFLPAWVRDFFN